MNYLAVKQKCEDLLRTGKAQSCSRILGELKFSDIPRLHLASFCALARRANEVDLALRALRPIIRPAVRNRFKPSLEETVEYAKDLLRVGAFSEADQLLKAVGSEDQPEVALAKGFSCIFQWNYTEALKHLNLYLASPPLEEYPVLLARVNRLACYQFLNHPDLQKEFENLKRILIKLPYGVLHANILEIYAQYLVDNAHWGEAKLVLENAEKLVVGEHNRNLHFIKKWKRILEALKTRSIPELEAFRAEALKHREWETLRTLDYYRVKIDPECVYAHKVFYGSPYLSFRLKLMELRDYPETYWLGDGSQKLDLWFPGQDEGQLAHRAAVLLLQDMYRPLLPGQIFSELYPDEYFNLDSLSGRVRKIVSRLGKWIEKNSFPLKLINMEGTYSLRQKRNSSILCHRTILSSDKLEFFFRRYLEAETVPSTTSEWAKVMQVKENAAAKILHSATGAKILKKIRSGRKNRYQLLKL